MSKSFHVHGISELRAKLRKRTKEKKRAYGLILRDMVEDITVRVLQRTPVQTGHTLANYVWTQGFNPGLDTWAGEPTPGTNQMPLGSEPNRTEAEARVWRRLRNIKFTQLSNQRLELHNNSEAFPGLEAGDLPEGDKFKPRSPNGMVGISIAEVSALLSAGHYTAQLRRDK